MGNLSHTSGNVGIGTNTPLVPLDVHGGSVRVSTSGSFEQSVAFSSGVGSWARGLYFYDSRATNSLNAVGVTGAIGMFGSGASPSSIFIGHGDTPWSGSNSIHLLTNGNVGIGTSNPATRLHVNGGVNISGVLNVNEISVFTASGGIRFLPTATNSTDVNTLDDYEEGTWTPSLTFGDGNPTTITYNTGSGGGAYARSGVYVKIGRLVWCHGRIQLIALSGAPVGGVVRITGLPFTPSIPTSVHPVGTVGYYVGLAAAITTAPSLYVEGSSDKVRLVKNGAGGISSMISSDFSANTDLMFSIIYGT